MRSVLSQRAPLAETEVTGDDALLVTPAWFRRFARECKELASMCHASPIARRLTSAGGVCGWSPGKPGSKASLLIIAPPRAARRRCFHDIQTEETQLAFWMTLYRNPLHRIPPVADDEVAVIRHNASDVARRLMGGGWFFLNHGGGQGCQIAQYG